MKIAGVEISHPDKVLFPDKDIRKEEMIRYYDRIADKMLPFLKDRPLTLERFTEGADQDGFYQKQASDYFPDFIDRVTVKTKDGEIEQVVCNNKKTLIYLANQDTITFHIWLSKTDKINRPDKVIFDLDPAEGAFEKVKEAAKKIKSYYESKGKDCKLMTSGKSGIHVYYNKNRKEEFDNLREEVKSDAEEIVEQYPDLLTTKTRIKKRGGKIFLDYLRNSYGQTAVCPYSLRANQSAGVACPLEWDELSKIKSSDQYHINNILKRMAHKGDS